MKVFFLVACLKNSEEFGRKIVNKFLSNMIYFQKFLFIIRKARADLLKKKEFSSQVIEILFPVQVNHQNIFDKNQQLRYVFPLLHTLNIMFTTCSGLLVDRISRTIGNQ